MTQLHLTMPQPGETITEGTIVEWRVKEGAILKEGDVLAQLETEKALFDHESPFEGKLLKIFYPDQSRVAVSTPIALMEVAPDKAARYIMLGLASEVSGNVDAAPVASKPAAASKTDTASPVAFEPATHEQMAEVTHVKMAPYVRRLAFDAGLSLDVLQKLAAGHEEGRVTKDAIEDYLKTKNIPLAPQSGSALRPVNTGSQETDAYKVQPYSPIRLRIAENMALSKSKIPHAHTGLTIDVTAVVEFREKNKEAFAKKQGVGLNFLSLIFPALQSAIKKFPVVNASFVDKGAQSEIRLFKQINLGVAVGSDTGLIIPVVKGVESMGFEQFNAALNDKITRSKQQKLKPDDFTGTTVIFNNFGFYGLNMGVQIIQYPLSATIGMGAIERKVVPVGESIGIRHMANFFLAFDHRIIDGLEAGSFLTELKKGIEGIDFNAL